MKSNYTFSCLRLRKCFIRIIAISFISIFFTTPSFASECRVTSSRPVVDYGKLVPGQEEHLAKGNMYPLNERNIVVNAFCSEPKKISLLFNGMTKNGVFNFGENGFVTIEASQAILDGKHVLLGNIRDRGNMSFTGALKDRVVILNNTHLVPVSGSSVLIGQQFQLMLKIRPMMNVRGLNPSDQTILRSSVNIEIITD